MLRCCGTAQRIMVSSTRTQVSPASSAAEAMDALQQFERLLVLVWLHLLRPKAGAQRLPNMPQQQLQRPARIACTPQDKQVTRQMAHVTKKKPSLHACHALQPLS